MHLRGLKTNIAITLAVILVLAMLLVDFVLLMIAQRDLLRSQEQQAGLLISAASKGLVDLASTATLEPFARLCREAGFERTRVYDLEGRLLWNQPPGDPDAGEFGKIAGEAIDNQTLRYRYQGSTWALFWKQRRDLIVAGPLRGNGRIVGAVVVGRSLEGVYQRIRHWQEAIAIYILINTILLTLVGGHRLARLFLLPLQRLVRRAEDYTETEPIFFNARQGDDEFKKLSTALNNMLHRIAADKDDMRATVASLEKANRELQQAQKDIIRAEKLASVGRLASGIAHEIGNPIGVVIGYLDLLKAENLPAVERAEYLRRAEMEIGRINTIIRQLLDLSRSSKEGAVVTATHDILRDIADVLKIQPLMADTRIELDLSAPDDRVFADPNQLRQVFLNLLINAADAIAGGPTQGPGCVVVRSAVHPDGASPARPTGPSLHISFHDNGPGIDPQNIGNVFDPFFTTKAPGKGTGLGLSVSFMIIASMGGSLQVTSPSGGGTTFDIRLPQASAPTHTTASAAPGKKTQ